MKPVNLPVKTIADRRLRFCMIDGDSKFYNSDDIHMNGCQPLFLGSDILYGLAVQDKNKCRIHARFAKQGLATKLVFRDCRIAGIRKGDEAYFYSVYGLFRAVFEYHSFSVQHQCLQHLTELWMRICPAESQPQIDVAYEVSMQNLVLIEDLPRVSELQDEDESDNDIPMAVSGSLTKKASVTGTGSSNFCGQETNSDNVLAQNDGTSCRGCLRRTSSKTVVCGQEVGTQTDNFIKVGLPETICTVCRIRTKMIEREKAEIHSMCQSAKNAKLQEFIEEDTEVVDRHGLMENFIVGQAIMAEYRTSFLRKDDEDVSIQSNQVDVNMQSNQVSIPLLCYDPNLITPINNPFHDNHASEICSEINQTGDTIKCTEQKVVEPHVLIKCVSPQELSGRLCDQSNSHQIHVSRMMPLASHRCQHTDASSIQSTLNSDTALPMDVTENVSALSQVQNYQYHEKKQPSDCVQVGDSSAVLSGRKSPVANNNVHIVTDSSRACSQPGMSRINNNSAFMDTVSPNKFQAEEAPEDSPQPVCTDAAGCVLNWIEEINKLRMLQESQCTNMASTSFDTSYESDFTPTSAMETSHLQDVQLEMVQLVLDFLLHCMKVIDSSSDLSAISEMLMLILSSAENSAKFAAAAQEWLVVSPLKLCALTVFGAWMGGEFHRFEPAISQRVTAFKENHISNISELPPAADMIAELFPSCMVVLASGWIGLKDLQIAEATEKDHCYMGQSGEVSALQHPNRNLYPVIQLILELLNNSLVSGIAHVVYCKLRHAS